ncbi:GntR family transcriptional regulator [Arthrobacter celericrescens]|uniref:GntR family transcriptional regulator n=1 Tax=Arthrobacter celericrescens TaxID=2320851 RepID=UPI000EA2A2BA|nr:GntR family transcriptional regulator [Arthrobacter celericrescens]
MTAGISLELRSAVPPYEQIRSQISSLIAVGSLAPGSRLPTVRSLAADLGIAAGTVARAYKELEAAGLIESRRRNGTIVLGPPPIVGASGDTPTAEVLATVDRLADAARKAGLDAEAVIGLLRGRLK